MEKRRHRRYSKRFKVRFGPTDFTSTGFTSDVSATGMFVVTSTLLTIGQRVHVELTVNEKDKLYFEGATARLMVVAPELRQLMKGGFGLRVLSSTELVGEMVPHLKDSARIVLTYSTKAGFQKVFETELKRGGCFVWTNTRYAESSIVQLEFDAEFANRAVAFEMRVVHVIPGTDGRFGTALMFVDQAAALAGLTDLAGP